MGKVKLALERQKRNWTQQHVAEQIDMTKAAYSNLENGNRNPSYDVLCKLETLFGKNHRQLFSPVGTNTKHT